MALATHVLNREYVTTNCTHVIEIHGFRIFCRKQVVYYGLDCEFTPMPKTFNEIFSPSINILQYCCNSETLQKF